MAWNWIPRWLGGGLERREGVQSQATAEIGPSDVRVSQTTAMQVSAVWAAVQLKASTMASLPLSFYRLREDGRERDASYRLAKLFDGKINRYQTRIEFFESLGLNLYLTGNAYALKQRMANGSLVGLLPLMTAQVETSLLDDGAVVYAYSTSSGMSVLSPESVWHLRLPGNGVTGLSPLDYARSTIGIAIAAERWASTVVQNGGKPTGVLTIDETLTPTQRAQVREAFKGLREGPNDSLMVLEADMKYQRVSMSPQDVELLSARRFQVEDIARFFGVPSVLLNDTSSTTVWGSGIEQIIEGWYKLGLRVDLERIEASIRANLMQHGERSVYDVEFDLDSLLRPDFETRVKTGSTAVQAGLMTRREWRDREWLPRKDGEDELTVQSALVPLEKLNKVDTNGNQAPPDR